MRRDSAAEELRRTEVELAERFVDEHRSEIRSCRALGGYLVWSEHRWKVDSAQYAIELAKVTASAIWPEVEKHDCEDRPAVSRFARLAESLRG